jgi:H+/Cl- antiporter ClcA
VIGAVCAVIAWVVRSIALTVRPVVHRSRVLVTTVLGVLVGLTAAGYQLVTDQSFTHVLFSGQSALPALVEQASDYTLGVLLLLGAAKVLAYALSLSAFRGGPVFPALFVGAVVGIALSGLPGMNLAAAIATGIGGMCAAMLRLPLTATLLAAVLMGPDRAAVTPQVVVAVVVAFVLTHVLPEPGPRPAVPPAAGTAAPVTSSAARHAPGGTADGAASDVRSADESRDRR